MKIRNNNCLILTVTNLMGQVVLTNANKEEVYRFIFGDNREYNKINDSKSVMSTFFVNRKYIVLRVGDEEKLFERLRKVVFIVSRDKTKILGAFTSINEAKKDKQLELYTSTSSLKKYLESGKLIPADKVYVISGKEGVDLLKSLGYLDEVLELIKKEEKE